MRFSNQSWPDVSWPSKNPTTKITSSMVFPHRERNLQMLPNPTQRPTQVSRYQALLSPSSSFSICSTSYRECIISTWSTHSTDQKVRQACFRAGRFSEMLAVMTACFVFFFLFKKLCIIVLAVWRQVQSLGLMKLGWIGLLLSVAAGGGEGRQFCLGFSTIQHCVTVTLTGV